MILISAEREMHKTTKLRLQKEFCNVRKTLFKVVGVGLPGEDLGAQQAAAAAEA